MSDLKKESRKAGDQPRGLAAPATRLAKDPKTSLILNGSRLIDILIHPDKLDETIQARAAEGIVAY
ncbi:hypothetical protein [Nitrobacter sp. TKz-YC02]|uniref:hypothetical protein n=1 Tax=Nitrobacter sp. TKz-YC02 TaxID=3398704 RepID=UPI003CFA45E3